MLPSTGYFKGINCPFYDSGLCERPYCHFRHVKKESQNGSNDGIESGAILQKLVSAAVQKVLQQTDTSATVSETAPIDSAADINKAGVSQITTKVTYNPTPISELKKINNVDSENKEDINEQRKRHIPVPYTPRKPASLPIRRPLDTNGASKPFIYIPPPAKYTPGSTDSVPLDPYTPKGGVDSTEKYLPGTEVELQEYKPNENTLQTTSKHNYVPSDKSVNKKKILEYKPTKVSTTNESSTVTYQPTPRSLAPCFSSDEEEPENKKRKLSSDLNGLDDLGPEFDILDQILDEEKKIPHKPDINAKKLDKVNDDKKGAKDDKEHKVSKSANTKEKHAKNESKHNDDKIDKKKDSTKHERKKSTSKSDEKKSSSSKESSKTSSKEHKSKTKEHKSREESKDKKNSKDKSRHSKGSHESSKHDKHRSKSSEKHSKHSSSSKSDSKRKDKNHHHKSSKESKEKSKSKKDKEKESISNGWADSDQVDNESIDLDNQDLYEMSDSDEESRTLECKRIFEEYVPTPINQNVQEPQKVEENNEDEYVPSKIRISRTADKNVKVIPKPPLKPDYKVSAAQAMAERLAKVKEYHASKIKIDTVNEDANKVDTRKSTLSAPNSGNSKIRIAHVPYASTLMNAKKNISPSTNIVKNEPSTSSTIAQTVKKGSQRVSHVPNEKFIDRPGVLEPLGSKIAANIRSTYLNKMIDECLKIYISAADAYARAQHEELATSKKCTTVPIYKNSAVMTVSRLRKELQECNGVKKAAYDCNTLQKVPQNVTGQSGNSGSWSIENKNRKVVESQEFHGAKLYKNIQKWVLSEEQLQENGYPRPHPSHDKGRAIIYGQNKQTPPKGFVRMCCRCKKDYTVDKKGFPCIKEECIYHPNRKYRVRGEVKYQCCSQDGTSDGCCVAPCHVYEYVDFENLKGYVKTLPPEREMEDYGVYSLDCEMCYTTQGLDLTRVTVINSHCKVVYETLIKPLHPIIDYNTRYSGITEEQMADVKTTLLEVQATLLAMFNSKSILIGHSLESDFKALKLIHNTVIDTSVLFPHKMGPPYKRALRNLSSEHLKKIIQNSVDGHDSAEDATVCMELIHYKLREDLKTR